MSSTRTTAFFAEEGDELVVVGAVGFFRGKTFIAGGLTYDPDSDSLFRELKIKGSDDEIEYAIGKDIKIVILNR